MPLTSKGKTNAPILTGLIPPTKETNPIMDTTNAMIAMKLLKNTIFAMSTMMLKMMLERLNLRISKSVMM